MKFFFPARCYFWVAILCFFSVGFQKTCIAQSPFNLQLSHSYPKNLSTHDYKEIQEALRRTSVDSLLKEMFQRECTSSPFTTYADIWGRCTKGLRQILIEENKGFFPKKKLVKMGNGGNRCVVCCVPFNGKYPQYLRSMKKAFKKTGFNGYFLYFLGGFPNPTGEEIAYAGVPYSFKIFAMVEAQQAGFTNVLWLDSALLPLRNIEPLFDHIEQNSALLDERSMSGIDRYIIPSTRTLLLEKTGVDVCSTPHLVTAVFGFKMDAPQSKYLLEQYYSFVRMGTPFLSCFPEEFVLGAITKQPMYSSWHGHPVAALFCEGRYGYQDGVEEYDLVRNRGFYFYHQRGR